MLTDPIGETKWKFKLGDALKRAKANKGQLFASKVFYVTNNIPLDKKLLKNVILAHGGQVSRRRVVRVDLTRARTWVTDTSAKPNYRYLVRQVVWPASCRAFLRRRRFDMATYCRSWTCCLLPRTRTQCCSHAGDGFE